MAALWGILAHPFAFLPLPLSRSGVRGLSSGQAAEARQ